MSPATHLGPHVCFMPLTLMPNSTSTTSDDLSTQFITFGNSLIPIGALTTLIGSDIAETLTLGERGPAGLVWCIASVFGAPSIIKACISGACPGWLRSLLGLRSIASDRAVGLDLKLGRKSRWAIKVRHTFHDEPLGVSCDAEALRKAHNETLSRDHPSCTDVYAFDRSTMRMVEGLQKTLPAAPHGPGPHLMYRVRTTIQSLALALSLLKCVELHYYWTNGAHHLTLISAIHFMFFFVSGWILAFRELFLARRLTDIGNLDTIIGVLPTWKKAGGEKKVVLGLLADPRTSIWWRLVWSIGGLLHIVSLILTYFILSKMTPAFTLAWAGFQVTWLGCRILTYYFTERMEPMANLMIVRHRWQDLDVLMKTRVLNLTLAACAVPGPHPPAQHRDVRGRLLLPTAHHEPAPSKSIEIEITAVIGDTVLSSAMWMVGSDVSPMDMYDTCLVFLSFPPPSPLPSSPSLGPPPAQSTFAIPAARVAHNVDEINPPDSENHIPVFVPRGTGRDSEYSQTWLYWIPCGTNRWLQIRSKVMTVLGRCTAEVLDDGQLSAILEAGNLNISLTHVKEVKETVKLSRVGVRSSVQPIT
ncbi:hypothetical protein F5887DRAFT_1282870 [Amanita rubescens]|nr:hypothetical protein F5887DRAFT_1282870 [Amanita rubescens]